MEHNNCYHVHTINRNMISISCLVKDGYELCIVNDNLTIRKSSPFLRECPIGKWHLRTKPR